MVVRFRLTRDLFVCGLGLDLCLLSCPLIRLARPRRLHAALLLLLLPLLRPVRVARMGVREPLGHWSQLTQMSQVCYALPAS